MDSIEEDVFENIESQRSDNSCTCIKIREIIYYILAFFTILVIVVILLMWSGLDYDTKSGV